MTKLTTSISAVLSPILSAVLTAALALPGCYVEEPEPSHGTSSSTGTTGAETSTGTTEAEPAGACRAPEDAPPSLPGVDLVDENDPDASFSCPNEWCTENVACGLCCDGHDPLPYFGHSSCCATPAGGQHAPNAAGQCGPAESRMWCEKTDPQAPGPMRRTPYNCEFPKTPQCPSGYETNSDKDCGAWCAGEGSACFGKTCEQCGGGA